MILTFYIFVYSILSAVFNADIIEKRDFHVSQAILRVFTFVGLLLFTAVGFNELLFVLFQLLTIYWIVFDAFLNIFRGKNVFYIGNTSYIDKKLGNNIYLIKGLFLVMSIIFCFVQF